MAKYRIISGKYYDRGEKKLYSPDGENQIRDWVHMPPTFAAMWQLCPGETDPEEILKELRDEKIEKETAPIVGLKVIESEITNGMYDVLNESSHEFVNDIPLTLDQANIMAGVKKEEKVKVKGKEEKVKVKGKEEKAK